MTSVMAHRGASVAHPENTLAAFGGARELGADWVELDIRRTADGSLVVHHVAHLVDGGALVDRRRPQIPDAVPDLAAALDSCRPMGVNVEIKNGRPDPDFDPTGHLTADLLVDLLHQRSGVDDVLVSSFDLTAIDRVRQRDRSVPTGWLLLGRGDVTELVDRAAARGHRAGNPPDASVDETLVTTAHGAGLAVNVWTVDDPGRMAELVDLGVDGNITNVPDVARGVVADHRGRG
jgi:glycerophosphoryl diester phosphodiesterase